MSTSPSVPQQLVEETIRLLRVFGDAEGQIRSQTIKALHLTEELGAASTDERARTIYAELLEKQKQVGAQGKNLGAGTQKLLRDYTEDNYFARREEVATKLSRVDAKKLAHEGIDQLE